MFLSVESHETEGRSASPTPASSRSPTNGPQTALSLWTLPASLSSYLSSFPSSLSRSPKASVSARRGTGEVAADRDGAKQGEIDEVNSHSRGVRFDLCRPGRNEDTAADGPVRGGTQRNAKEAMAPHSDGVQTGGTGTRDGGEVSPFDKKPGESYAAYADRLHRRDGFSLYFDNNSSTMTDPRVYQEMAPFFECLFGNPGSAHERGRINKTALEEARVRVARCLGVSPSTVIFTSGATESLNWAIKCGAHAQCRRGVGRHIVTTRVEHPAVLEICKFLQEDHGFGVSFCPVDCFGFVDLGALPSLLSAETALVSIPHANAEIGAIQPIEESLGKVPVNIPQLGADLVTIAGHKIYAPKGVGALYVGPRACIGPLLHGGGQEGRLRGGTENVPYCVALGKACELIAEGWAPPSGVVRADFLSGPAPPSPSSLPCAPAPLTPAASTSADGASPEAGSAPETQCVADQGVHTAPARGGGDLPGVGERRGEPSEVEIAGRKETREEGSCVEGGSGLGAERTSTTRLAEGHSGAPSGSGVRTPQAEKEGQKQSFSSWLPSLAAAFRQGGSSEEKHDNGSGVVSGFPATPSAFHRFCSSIGFSRVLSLPFGSRSAGGTIPGEWRSFWPERKDAGFRRVSAHPQHMQKTLIRFTHQFFIEVSLLTQWTKDQLADFIRINGPLGQAGRFFEVTDGQQGKSLSEMYGALPNTLSLSIRGAHGPEIVRLLRDRLCISAGCTCHSSGELTSATLQAIQLDRDWARGTIRISTGRFTTLNEATVAGRLLARFLISENLIFGKSERLAALSAGHEPGEKRGAEAS
ncbi:putative cysteine desulfurase [Neospora caninum Liverpool]|uniref:Putative cysteine desulfurase n=1 Tax=Neospora caninum (strain Liverpool) TaxID=572307 RepID=F0VQN7_NEOCL|nr:putative cysteine desulfurase [Neospora caninum Liverpool]CBZ56034.1 putative cysteine desulfurase [Neospora caninum Liverpool]|eukprot:XP_003886060.1 putative cysteine desulfurase [Neospora caninum Liverpool]